MVDEVLRIVASVEGTEQVETKLRNIQLQIKNLSKIFDSGLISQSNYVKTLRQMTGEFDKLANTVPATRLNKFTKALKNIQGAMLNFGLSIMFAGMQIQRTFMQIARSAIDSFMKISAGQTPAGQAINALAAGFEFLKYSIGDAIATALMPLLPMFLDIIDAVSEWIQQNPQLTALIIGLGVALGSLLFIGGQVLTFINGLLGLLAVVAPEGLAAFATSISSLLAPIALIIAAVILLWRAWETNFNGIRELVSNFVNNFLSLMSSLAGNATKIIEGFLKIIDGIFKGDTKMIMEGIIMIVKNAISALIKIFLFLINTIIDIAFFLVTGFIRIFSTILSLAIEFSKAFIKIILTPLQSIIDSLNSIAAFFGINLNIPNVMEFVNPVMNAMSGLISGFGQGLADELNIAKTNFMSGIGLGQNLGKTLETVDKGVNFAVDQITVIVNGNVDESNVKELSKEVGRATATDLFSFYNRGVSPSGSQ